MTCVFTYVCVSFQLSQHLNMKTSARSTRSTRRETMLKWRSPPFIPSLHHLHHLLFLLRLRGHLQAEQTARRRLWDETSRSRSTRWALKNPHSSLSVGETKARLGVKTSSTKCFVFFCLFFKSLHLQRQFSSPTPRQVHIHLSNVVGFQSGNNNTMYIYEPDRSERRRHPTAPSSVNLPPLHPGSWRDETGGVGQAV